MKEARRPVIWSPEAEQDLLDIWKYASAAVADKQLREIGSQAHTLGGLPRYGRARDEVRVGLRSARSGRYVIFYRVTKDAIEVVRVLDERRDVETIFSEEEWLLPARRAFKTPEMFGKGNCL